MIKVEFIDGSEDIVESDDGEYTYDHSIEMFKVAQNKMWIMYPREFVKSIRVI